jgi:regulator of RNase E activity RraB
MNQQYGTYLCRVNDERASIFLNLGLRRDAPMASHPCLLWVWVPMQTPREDGLSDSAEAPTLYSIEDELNSRLGESLQAIPCGRITTQGRREFYFYAASGERFSEIADAVFSRYRGYPFALGSQPDPMWIHYLEVLFPSDEQLQRMANTDVLDSLARQGDLHQVPRNVRHWIFFNQRTARRMFRDAAEQAGYTIDSQQSGKGDHPFSICVSRVQAVDQESIDATVIDLFRLAKRCEGRYDGWETQVMTQ